MSSVDKCGTHLLADVRNYWQHVLEPAYNTGHEYIQMVELLEEKVEADAQGVQPASMAASNVKVTEKPPDVIPFIVTPVEQPDTDSSLVDRSLAMVANGPHCKLYPTSLVQKQRTLNSFTMKGIYSWIRLIRIARDRIKQYEYWEIRMNRMT